MSVEEGIVIKGERPTENKNRKKERERKLKEGRIQNYRQEKSREMKDKRGSNQSKGRGAIRRKKNVANIVIIQFLGYFFVTFHHKMVLVTNNRNQMPLHTLHMVLKYEYLNSSMYTREKNTMKQFQ